MIMLREHATRPEKGAEPERHSDSDVALEKPRPLRCRSCGATISDANQIFGVRQVFANPAGRVFEILRVRNVRSVEVWGEPTTEHTWFSGYAWRALVCGECLSHLGWQFDAVSGSEPAVFFGLITSEIVEGD